MAENNSTSGAGFMLGALIGAGAVFLLGTKKGKKLLKVITEEGVEGITEIAQLIDSDMEEEDVRRLKRTLTRKGIEKQVAKKINQIKKSDTVREISDKIEELKESDTAQYISDKARAIKESDVVVKKVEPIMEDVREEGEAVAKQVQKSAKRLFKGIPKRLRK